VQERERERKREREYEGGKDVALVNGRGLTDVSIARGEGKFVLLQLAS